MKSITDVGIRIGLLALFLFTLHQFLLHWKLVTEVDTREETTRYFTTIQQIQQLPLNNSTSSLTNVATSSSSSKLFEDVGQGVLARSFDPWNRPLPCFPPDEKKHFQKPVSPAHVHQGFLFMKLMKTGGSTAAGINIRIAREAARRENNNNNTRFQFCQGRWEHAWGYEMLQGRNRNTSFTWTLVREPTRRVISQFFHFKVSRENVTPTDYEFHRYLNGEMKVLRDYYLQVLSTKMLFGIRDPKVIINQILDDYDFVGVTERFEESVVALMMLLGLPMGTVMYLNAKRAGNYDDGAFNGCIFIHPSKVSRGMNEYFNSSRWKAVVGNDELLYKAANRSLDLTIGLLGNDVFKENLKKFQRAQKIAEDRCLPLEAFPCTSAGMRNKKRSCLWKDSGCGSGCLDTVASELDLW
jgi:hypothetical protein